MTSLPKPSPKQEPDAIPAVATETKPRPMALPDDDGWIKWDGGECPVDDDTRVQIRCRDGWEDTDKRGEPAKAYFASPDVADTDTGKSGNWWRDRGSDDDIRFYRIVSEAGVTK